jgi:hypothetical protein
MMEISKNAQERNKNIKYSIASNLIKPKNAGDKTYIPLDKVIINFVRSLNVSTASRWLVGG